MNIGGRTGGRLPLARQVAVIAMARGQRSAAQRSGAVSRQKSIVQHAWPTGHYRPPTVRKRRAAPARDCNDRPVHPAPWFNGSRLPNNHVLQEATCTVALAHQLPVQLQIHTDFHPETSSYATHFRCRNIDNIVTRAWTSIQALSAHGVLLQPSQCRRCQK